MDEKDLNYLLSEKGQKEGMRGCFITTIIIIIVATIVIVNMCSDDSDKKQTKTYSPKPPSPEQIIGTKEWKNRTINFLKKDSIEISKTNYLNKAKSTNSEMSDAISHLSNLMNWDSGINETETQFYQKDKRASVPLKYIKKKSKSIYNKVLPEYRKAFAKNMANALWEKDIYITASGNQNTILNVTGGTFAANANIKDFQEIIKRDVAHFKFKEVRYRWYKGASEYTCYKIE